MRKPQVIPIGYSTPFATQRIDDLLTDPFTLLIDMRHKPTSRVAGWKRQTLERMYGSQYLWLGDLLGNIHAGTDLPIELADPDPGIERVGKELERGYRLIFLCQCAEYGLPPEKAQYDRCHLHKVVRHVQQAFPLVEVVQPETLPKVNGYRCLSIRQPYASWLANPSLFVEHGFPPKLLENRDWQNSYRGELFIHASKTFEEDALRYWNRRLPGLEDIVPTSKKDYPFGAIVGRSQLTDVVSYSNSPWFCGQYGFVLADAELIEPIFYPGALGIFEIPRSVLKNRKADE